jgi:hypothetical protein
MGRQLKGCSEPTYISLFKAWNQCFGKKAITIRQLKQQVEICPKSRLSIAIRAFDPHNGISFNRLVLHLQRMNNRVNGGYQLAVHWKGKYPNTYRVSKVADAKITGGLVQFPTEGEAGREVKIKIDYRKWDVQWSCGEFVVRKKGKKAIAFIARSEWALKLGLRNCESRKLGWGEASGQRPKEKEKSPCCNSIQH